MLSWTLFDDKVSFYEASKPLPLRKNHRNGHAILGLAILTIKKGTSSPEPYTKISFFLLSSLRLFLVFLCRPKRYLTYRGRVVHIFFVDF